jgi:signal transduction histidine kinase
VFVLAPLYLTVSSDAPTLLLITPHPGAAAVVDTVQRAVFAGASLATAAVLAARFRAATRPGRRALLPALAGAGCLLLYVTLLVLDLVIGPDRTSPIATLISWIAAISIVTVPLAFLAGLLRSRLARGGLAALFRELRAVQPADLQPALARALGDPSLVIAFPVGDGHFADADGAPVVLPDPDSRRSVATVEQDGLQVAALVYDRALDDDPELVDAVGAAATIALQNRALQAAAERSHAELQDSRGRIIAAADAERRRIERNLHDGAQQRLVSLALQLSLIQRRIRADPDDAEQLVTAAGGELARSLEELRELARGIHPAALDLGLDIALEALAQRSAVPTVASVDPGPRLPPPIEFAAYFVASEALTNVAKYAQAGTAAITVAREPHQVVVQITDDGIGGADPALGTGLRGLDDRVQALGGQLRVTSPAGAGTVVTAELPTLA